jgi:hypothetical protein
MRLRARIERCLEKGRRDASCHRGLPERLWWDLWARGRGESGRADDPALDDSIPTPENLARKPPPKPEHSLGEKIVGAGEAALTMATGVVGVVAGSAAAAGKIVKDVVTGEFVPGEPEAEKLAMETAENLTYSPRTEAGRDAVRGVAKAMDAAKIAPYVPGLGTVGIAGRAKVSARAPASRKTVLFVSKDPLVGETANAIEKACPGAVKDVNVPIKNPKTGRRSDADIMLRNGDVIEVKSGGGKGTTSQVSSQVQIIGDSGEVIVYGPKMKPSVVVGIQKAGTKVFTSMEELTAYINAKGAK